jgi:hypothetical protein
MGKRGQVTLFIILGVVIVSSIVALFMFTRGAEEANTPQKLGPRGFIDKCARDIVEDSVDEIMDSGSVLDPSLYIRYNGSNYTYLCYQADFLKPCKNLYPLMQSRIERLIYSETRDRIKEECFDTLREDFENKGYDVTGGSWDYEANILPGEIRLTINFPIVISNEDTSQSFENFNTKILSPVYDIIHTTNHILNFESQYCHYDTTNHMLVYPDEKITVTTYEHSKLYKIESRSKGTEFKFAVRGCVYPPGFF